MLVRALRLLIGQWLLPLRLRRALPQAVRRILQDLDRAGYEARLVGGCVRDLLLGGHPHDWDIATTANAAQILTCFPHGREMGRARGGGTVLVVQDEHPYEVTSYRGEDLAADVARRDFTINALALDLNGRLYDSQRGRRDLRWGLIRACGHPHDRMIEDPLRMLRAVRFAAQFGFSLDGELTAAIGLLAPRLCQTAPERIGAEFTRLLLTDRPAQGMQMLRKLGLLAAFAPELLEMVGVEQNRYHAYPVWEHALVALAQTPPVLTLRLAALLHDVGKPRALTVDEDGERHFYRHEQIGAEMADQLLERLRFESAVRRKVVHLVRFHMDLHLGEGMTDGAIRRMVRRIGLEHLNDLIQLRRADRIASGKREGELGADTLFLLQQVERVLAADAALQVTDLAVTGDDVVAVCGRPPGPYVGQMLQRLLDEVLEDRLRNTRQALLERLAELSKL